MNACYNLRLHVASFEPARVVFVAGSLAGGKGGRHHKPSRPSLWVSGSVSTSIRLYSDTTHFVILSVKFFADPIMTDFEGRSFEFVGEVGAHYNVISELNHQVISTEYCVPCNLQDYEL